MYFKRTRNNASAAEQLLILEPGRTEKNYWTDLWRFRELFLILAWRDLAAWQLNNKRSSRASRVEAP